MKSAGHSDVMSAMRSDSSSSRACEGGHLRGRKIRLGGEKWPKDGGDSFRLACVSCIQCFAALVSRTEKAAREAGIFIRTRPRRRP